MNCISELIDSNDVSMRAVVVSNLISSLVRRTIISSCVFFDCVINSSHLSSLAGVDVVV